MKQHVGLWSVIGCALLFCLFFAVQRAALEKENVVVELVIDGDGLAQVAAMSATPVAELFSRWQALGVTAIAVGTGAEDDTPPTQDDSASAFSPTPSLTFEQLLDLLPPGIRIVPRTSAVLAELSLREFEPGPFIPQGDTLEGYPDIQPVVSLLRQKNIPLGIVEFADMKGVEEGARRLGYDAVFVHSIPPKELLRLTDGQAVARFHRAALERQARVLYIHPRWDEGTSDADIVLRNEDYIEAIAKTVERAGLQLGPVRPLPRWTTSVAAPVAAVVAAAAACLLLWRRRWPSLPAFFDVAALVAAAGGVLLFWKSGRPELARQGAAFAAAIAFAPLAVVAASDGADWWRQRQGFARGMGVGFIFLASLTAAGAIFVVAALGDSTFMLKLDQFRGVKLAHVLPFLIVGVSWWLPSIPFAPRPSLRFRFRWKYVFVGLLLTAFAFILVARTGHDLLPVSQLERDVRQWLETVLPVRPRTKEFLLGYPALLLGLFTAARGNVRLSKPLLLLGTLVPVSVINSFAHAHVALSVSFVRSVYGLLLGGGLTFVALALLVAWAALTGRKQILADIGQRDAAEVSRPLGVDERR